MEATPKRNTDHGVTTTDLYETRLGTPIPPTWTTIFLEYGLAEEHTGTGTHMVQTAAALSSKLQTLQTKRCMSPYMSSWQTAGSQYHTPGQINRTMPTHG